MCFKQPSSRRRLPLPETADFPSVQRKFGICLKIRRRKRLRPKENRFATKKPEIAFRTLRRASLVHSSASTDRLSAKLFRPLSSRTAAPRRTVDSTTWLTLTARDSRVHSQSLLLLAQPTITFLYLLPKIPEQRISSRHFNLSYC